VFSLKAGLIGSGAIVGAAVVEVATSVESKNGFLETGRPFVVGLGRAGLGGPFRFRKGLLERRGEGPRSRRERKGVSQWTWQGSDVLCKAGYPQVVKRGWTTR
jgi:hypothetical protein